MNEEVLKELQEIKKTLQSKEIISLKNIERKKGKYHDEPSDHER